MLLSKILTFLCFVYSIVCNLNDFFCFPLCAVSQCDGIREDQCRNCTSGFKKATSNTSSNCVVIDPMVNGQRYQPISITQDVTYGLNGIFPLSDLIISQNGTVKSPDNQCTKDNNTEYEYLYYGNFINTSIVKIAPASSVPSIIYFRVRLRFWIFTIDEWNQNSKLSIKFLTNTSQAAKTYLLNDTNMNQTLQMCYDQLFPQRYRIIDSQWLSNTTVIPEFQLSIIGNNYTNPWGIKQIILMVRMCHPYCTSCYNDNNWECYNCDFLITGIVKSGTICQIGCAGTWGVNLTDPLICLKCMNNCWKCYAAPTNCSQCVNNYFLLINGTNISCLQNCPTHYLKNTTGADFCDVCNSNCQNCSITKTNCTSCYPETYLFKNYCYNPCPAEMYPNDTALKCQFCQDVCLSCVGLSTNCTSCELSGLLETYLKNFSCITDCGVGFFKQNYGGAGPNLCLPCDSYCVDCEFNQTFCYNCNPNYYLYQNQCNTTCPVDYFPDINTWTCLLCATYCVDLQTKLFFKDSLKYQLIFDLLFAQDLNWTATDLQNFVIISQNDPLLSLNIHFNIIYKIISPKNYQVIVEPKGYTFLSNVTFTFQTIQFPGIYHRAINSYPFKLTNYNRNLSMTWYLIKSPGFTDFQKKILDIMSTTSDTVLEFTTNQYIQEIKKTGFFSLIFTGAQATSVACLINSIPSQNFYQGVRLWSSMVFFDVPQWQMDSDKQKYIVSLNQRKIVNQSRLLLDSNKITQSRKLFDTSTINWRFERTGQSSFFIFDTYMNIFLILLCWTLVIIGNCFLGNRIKYKYILGKFYSLTHKIHQISIFYITLATMLEWIYFDSASTQRWISFGMCLAFNLYFFSYQLYIYYDMINYPKAHIGNDKYQYYCLKYGSILKNIRYVQYNPNQQWKLSHWFRPYNFHIFSYYKKFLMMISLPIFYQTMHVQIAFLIGIQLIQMLRFLIIWPFKSKIRNIIRLFFDACLQIFFISIMIQGFMVRQIIKNDPNTIQISVDWFINFGWVGFVLVFIFNVGHFFIFIFDFIIGCKLTNRQLMNEARKNYYMQKINSYQDQNLDISIQIVNKWVKLGNLNEIQEQKLAEINFKLEALKFYKNKKGYFIELNKVIRSEMKKKIDFRVLNNIQKVQVFKKEFLLTKNLGLPLQQTLDNLYNQNAAFIDVYSITIKTYQKINQSLMKPGEKIIQDINKMHQIIQVQTIGAQKKITTLNNLLKEFPLDIQVMKGIS